MAFSTDLVVVFPKRVTVKSITELVASGRQEVQLIVQEVEDRTYTIRVGEAMEQLTKVTDCFRLAFAGNPSPSNFELLSSYHKTLGSSLETTQLFVLHSVDATNQHVRALRDVEKGEIQRALKQLSACADHAQTMAGKTHRLIIKIKALAAGAEEGLKATMLHKTTSEEEKKKIEKILGDWKAQQASQTKETEQLEQLIEQEQQEETELRGRIDSARKWALITGILKTLVGLGSSIVGGPSINIQSGTSSSSQEPSTSPPPPAPNLEEVSDIDLQLERKKLALARENRKDSPSREHVESLESEILSLEHQLKVAKERVEAMQKALEIWSEHEEKKAVSLEKKEQILHTRRIKHQEKQRQLNAKLAEAAERIKQQSVEQGSLEQVITGFEMAITALSAATEIFGRTRLFLKGVERHTRALSNIERISELSEQTTDLDEFKEAIQENGWNWLVLAHISYKANQAMNRVFDGIGGLLRNLPISAQARAKVIEEFQQITF